MDCCGFDALDRPVQPDLTALFVLECTEQNGSEKRECGTDGNYVHVSGKFHWQPPSQEPERAG